MLVITTQGETKEEEEWDWDFIIIIRLPLGSKYLNREQTESCVELNVSVGVEGEEGSGKRTTEVEHNYYCHLFC